MSRAQAEQLPLMLSADSARLQLDCERAEAYARDQHDRAHALAEENATLRAALKAEEARRLALERQLRAAETLARTWQAAVDVLQRADLSGPSPIPNKDVLNHLLTLAHPDKWSQGQPATELAHELTVTINAARKQLEGRP